MTRRVEIIGGGPAGLYAARLLRLKDPRIEVVVHERMEGSAQTFGFGVGLTESTMRNLESADPETADLVRRASYVGHSLELKGRADTVTLHGARNLAIGRARLLDILGDAAAAVGVELRTGVSAGVASTDADVVVAADGVRSATREKYAAEFGVRAALGRSRFVWCGADFAVDSAFFSAVEQGDSMFVAHAYPYAVDRSTFLIEIDDVTWRSSGLDELDASVPWGETDHASVALLERAFASELRGGPLLTNRTRWSRFTNLTLDRWSVGNIVLLGDAAHTAHYTLGSGTKLALEDAIALADALTGEASVPEALTAYEQTRRPPVERFKKLAHRSQAWWDSYRVRASWSAEQLAVSYMTRSGNLSLADYAAEQPESARRALASLGGQAPARLDDLESWVLARPVRDPGLTLPARVVSRRALNAATAVHELTWTDSEIWGDAADAALGLLGGTSGPPILLTGPSDPDAIAARIDMSERLRLQSGRPVGVALPERQRSLAATAIAAGRADFVVTR
ncbi:FAD-dependent monooxygenase [Streptomyces sp. NPDC005963]|uniref:FAD-dependent monooxygenase n=1 Tax=Streptomyces sp. NPDC005963 TaxID=3156721 RepID=UPI00340E093A